MRPYAPGMRDAAAWAMRMKKLNIDKLMKSALHAMPALPFIARRRRRQYMLPLVLSALGVAVLGGAAAVMLLSPRTRHRALDMAKDRYGRVKGRYDQLDVKGKLRMHKKGELAQPLENGLTAESGTDYSRTGAV